MALSFLRAIVRKVTGNVEGDVQGNVDGSVASVTGAVASVSGNVDGNVTGNVGSLGTTAKADVNTQVDNAHDTAIPGSPTANSINERVKAIDDKLPSGTISDLTQAQVNTQVDNAHDTAIPGSPTANSINERIKVIDDKLPAGTISDYAGGDIALTPTGIDEIWDELATGHTTSNSLGKVLNDLRQRLPGSGTLNIVVPRTAAQINTEVDTAISDSVPTQSENSEGSTTRQDLTTDTTQDSKGAWVELLASTAFKTTHLLIYFRAVTRLCRLDIGTGAGGSEVVKIADLFADANSGNTLAYSVPLTIPSGTRLAARAANVQDAVGTSVHVSVTLMGP